VASSVGGSVKECQEILDFAAEHNITANVRGYSYGLYKYSNGTS
jgi:D-arabinose 1-dehydrogenase-like Zn-dependent alcohol dehydrogenase